MQLAHPAAIRLTRAVTVHAAPAGPVTQLEIGRILLEPVSVLLIITIRVVYAQVCDNRNFGRILCVEHHIIISQPRNGGEPSLEDFFYLWATILLLIKPSLQCELRIYCVRYLILN